MLKRIFLTFPLIAFLAACGSPPATRTPANLPTTTRAEATFTLTPSLLPDPSASTPTDEPSTTLEPFFTDTPTSLPLFLISLTPSATPQLSPFLASAAIEVQAPGPLSKVLSPIRVHGYIIPGFSNMVRIELYGEDGRLIYRKLSRFYPEFKWAYFSTDITFETHGAAELGRLQISTENEAGRTVALASAHLLLLREGYDQINPPGNLDEPCQLFSPIAKVQVSGGMVTLSGIIRPFNGKQLIIELVTPNGNVIGTRLVNVTPSADDSYVPFLTDVPYTIFAPTKALLTVHQDDDRIPGKMYLYSQEILLNP